MKKPIHILKTWFETGDKPTESQFSDLIDSFHHKDDGAIVKEKTVNQKGDVHLVFSDQQEVIIEKFIPDSTKPMEYIDGLNDLLANIKQTLDALRMNKVDREDGKGLSDTNFTQNEKDKLEGLEKYNPPVSQPISYIEGLTEIIEDLSQYLEGKVDKEDGKGLSDSNFSQEEKTKLANLNPDLRVYNLSNATTFLNHTYFGRKVYGVLLEIPIGQDGNYSIQHNLNVLTYLKIELWEDGLPLNNTGQIAQEDLAKRIVKDNAGSITLSRNSITTTGYQFPENKLIYMQYIELTEGVGADTVGTTTIGQ